MLSLPTGPPRAVVLGAGNPFRRDDGAGLALVQRIARRVPPAVEVREARGEAAELLDAFAGVELAIVADAMASGAPPGTVRRFDALADPLPSAFAGTSSHGLGVAAAVALGRVLGKLPPRLVLYGIEGEDFGDGEGLSPAVARAVEEAAGRVLGELGDPGRATDRIRLRPVARE